MNNVNPQTSTPAPLCPDRYAYYLLVFGNQKEKKRTPEMLAADDEKAIELRKQFGVRNQQGYEQLKSFSTGYKQHRKYLQHIQYEEIESEHSCSASCTQKHLDKAQDNHRCFLVACMQFLSQTYKLPLSQEAKDPSELIDAFLANYQSLEKKGAALKELIGFLVTFHHRPSTEHYKQLLPLLQAHEKELITSSPLPHFYCLCKQDEMALTLIASYNLHLESNGYIKENHILYRHIHLECITSNSALPILLAIPDIFTAFKTDLFQESNNNIAAILGLIALKSEMRANPIAWIKTLEVLAQQPSYTKIAEKLKLILANHLLESAVRSNSYSLARYALRHGANGKGFSASDDITYLKIAYDHSPCFAQDGGTPTPLFQLLLEHGAPVNYDFNIYIQDFIRSEKTRTAFIQYLFSPEIPYPIAKVQELKDDLLFALLMNDHRNELEPILNELLQYGASLKNITEYGYLLRYSGGVAPKAYIKFLQKSELLQKNDFATEFLIGLSNCIWSPLRTEELIPLVKKLIQLNANLDKVLKSLHNDSFYVITPILLEHGAYLQEPERRQALLKNSLLKACTSNDSAFLEYILALPGIDLTICDEEGKTLLEITRQQQQAHHLIMQLLTAGAPLPPNTTRAQLETELFFSALDEFEHFDLSQKQEDKILSLLDQLCSKNPNLIHTRKDDTSKPPLEQALSNANVPLVCLFMKSNKEPLSKDSQLLFEEMIFELATKEVFTDWGAPLVPLYKAGIFFDDVKKDGEYLLDHLYNKNYKYRVSSLLFHFPTLLSKNKQSIIDELFWFSCTESAETELLVQETIAAFIKMGANLRMKKKNRNVLETILQKAGSTEKFLHERALFLLQQGIPTKDKDEVLFQIAIEAFKLKDIVLLQRVCAYDKDILKKQIGRKYLLDSVKQTLDKETQSLPYDVLYEAIVIQGAAGNNMPYFLKELLIYYFEKNNPKAVAQLLKLGANANTPPYQENKYLLDYAHTKGFKEIACLLVVHQARCTNPEIPSFYLKVGLASKDTTLIVAALQLQHGIKQGGQFLCEAIDNGLHNLLLDNGYDPNPSASDPKKYHPMHHAILQNNADAVKSLIQKGANLKDKIPPLNRTPFHVACASNHLDCVKQFIAHPECPFQLADIAGYTPLHTACIQGHEDLIKLLLKTGTSVRMINDQGQTPFEMIQNRALAGALKPLFDAQLEREELILLDKKQALLVPKQTLPQPVQDKLSALSHQIQASHPQRQLLVYKMHGSLQCALTEQKPNPLSEKPAYTTDASLQQDKQFKALFTECADLLSQCFTHTPSSNNVPEKTNSTLDNDSKITQEDAPAASSQGDAPKKRKRHKSKKKPENTPPVSGEEIPVPPPLPLVLINKSQVLARITDKTLHNKTLDQLKEMIELRTCAAIRKRHDFTILQKDVCEWRVTKNHRLLFLLNDKENKVYVINFYIHNSVDRGDYLNDIPVSPWD